MLLEIGDGLPVDPRQMLQLDEIDSPFTGFTF